MDNQGGAAQASAEEAAKDPSARSRHEVKSRDSRPPSTVPDDRDGRMTEHLEWLMKMVQSQQERLDADA